MNIESANNPTQHQAQQARKGSAQIANHPTEDEMQNLQPLATRKAQNEDLLSERVARTEPAAIPLKSDENNAQRSNNNNKNPNTTNKSKEEDIKTNPAVGFVAKYENKIGLMKFEEVDIQKAKSCCCTKVIGLADYPCFQVKPDQNRISFSKIHILANPTSGGGAGKKMRDSIESQLLKAKIGYRTTNSTSVAHFQEIVDTFDFTQTDEILLICGGDGSIFMALNQLALRQEREAKAKNINPEDFQALTAYPIIVVPGGTGNDLCSSLGFNHLQAVNMVEKYLWKQPVEFKQIDICRCRIKNEKDEWKTYYFSCQSGIGFAGRVDVKAKKMGYMFRLKYRVAALLHVISAQTDMMTISIDGNTVIDNGPIRFMEVNNVPRTGGGFRACPIAQVNDGLLDLIVMSAKSRMQMLKGLSNAGKEGMHVYQDNTKYYRGREIRVTVNNSKAIEIEMDGEDFWCTEAIFDIHPTLVKVPY